MSIATMCNTMINTSNRNRPVNHKMTRVCRSLPYSPLWRVKSSGSGNKITDKTIVFANGERLKRCPKCESWLPSDTINFTPSKSAIGLSSYCRVCDRARFRIAKINKRNT